jgi:NADPH:quinone reductase-like Zn-dependent oxidoreductase
MVCMVTCNLARPGDGAFAEYIVVKGDMQIHIPDRLSFEEAASVGVGILTAGMGVSRSRTAITRCNEGYNIVRRWCC